MKHIIQFKVYKGEKYYVGEGIDLPIITQGHTIDETVENIKEALALHLEDENLSESDLAPHSPILINFEIEPLYV